MCASTHMHTLKCFLFFFKIFFLRVCNVSAWTYNYTFIKQRKVFHNLTGRPASLTAGRLGTNVCPPYVRCCDLVASLPKLHNASQDRWKNKWPINGASPGSERERERERDGTDVALTVPAGQAAAAAGERTRVDCLFVLRCEFGRTGRRTRKLTNMHGWYNGTDKKGERMIVVNRLIVESVSQALWVGIHSICNWWPGGDSALNYVSSEWRSTLFLTSWIKTKWKIK